MIIRRTMIAIVLFAMFSMSKAAADDQSSWFYPTCNRDLKVADSFVDDCLAHARTQTRYFNGAPETHSYYFWPGNTTDSHFGMGCMVGSNGKIMYLGMYYTTHPKNWAIANTATLRYIDFQGNVGLTVDGEPVNLLGVRQFHTDKIPARYTIRQPRKVGGSDTNCEEHSAKDGDWIAPANLDDITLSETKSRGQDQIQWCYITVPPYCETHEYTVLTGSNEGRILYHGLAESVFITEDGSCLFKTTDMTVLCDAEHYSKRLNFPTLAYEICTRKASQ